MKVYLKMHVVSRLSLSCIRLDNGNSQLNTEEKYLHRIQHACLP